MGGPALWVIAALSVAALALALWKLWHLVVIGAFGGQKACERAQALWVAGAGSETLAALAPLRSARARVVHAAVLAANAPLSRAGAEATTEQLARSILVEARAGLRGLDLAASVGPLLGLLGTVTGMIVAFQGLQSAGVRADTATLAGGI